MSNTNRTNRASSCQFTTPGGDVLTMTVTDSETVVFTGESCAPLEVFTVRDGMTRRDAEKAATDWVVRDLGAKYTR